MVHILHSVHRGLTHPLTHSPTHARAQVSTIAIILLIGYTFFTTVYIVNLMIAIMTTQYERIKDQSILFRRFRFVAVVAEYKDMRSATPPPFLLLAFVWNALGYCFTLTTGGKGKQEIGFADSMWQSTADALWKKERAARDVYLTDLDSEGGREMNMLSMLTRQVDHLQAALSKNHEYYTGKPAHLEAHPILDRPDRPAITLIAQSSP